MLAQPKNTCSLEKGLNLRNVRYSVHPSLIKYKPEWKIKVHNWYGWERKHDSLIFKKEIVILQKKHKYIPILAYLLLS